MFKIRAGNMEIVLVMFVQFLKISYSKIFEKVENSEIGRFFFDIVLVKSYGHHLFTFLGQSPFYS